MLPGLSLLSENFNDLMLGLVIYWEDLAQGGISVRRDEERSERTPSLRPCALPR